MSHYRLWGGIALVPVLSALIALTGCGGGSSSSSGGGSKESSGSKESGGGSKTASGERTPIEVKGKATLKGRVTFAGASLPTPRDLKPEMEKQGDKDHCVKGDTQSQEWIISPDKGVANVVVFLKAPEGSFFKVPDDKRNRTDTVIMDQPFCAFQPHVVAFNPSVFDPATKKQVKTGQILKVVNSAPINHNTGWSSAAIFNTGKNVLLPAKKGELMVEAKPCRDTDAGKEDILKIACDIHKWMSARAVALDHPYYAVTDKDGKYEIKDAPADAEVDVVYWHESMGDAINKAPRQKIKLKPGENTQDFTVGK
jgi:hypothetical protein